jgi:hypothetical protein
MANVFVHLINFELKKFIINRRQEYKRSLDSRQYTVGTVGALLLELLLLFLKLIIAKTIRKKTVIPPITP